MLWIVLGLIALLALFMVVTRVGGARRTADPAVQQAALADLRAKGWQEIERGLLWHRISGDGSGRHPTPADTVTINYEGKLIDGTVFDSSWKRGAPATFDLGGLIEAWRLALPKAGVGDTIEIAVPAELGYGAGGSGPIPGGAVLLFKIELLAIQ